MPTTSLIPISCKIYPLNLFHLENFVIPIFSSYYKLPKIKTTRHKKWQKFCFYVNEYSHFNKMNDWLFIRFSRIKNAINRSVLFLAEVVFCFRSFRSMWLARIYWNYSIAQYGFLVSLWCKKSANKRERRWRIAASDASPGQRTAQQVSTHTTTSIFPF